ncbi:phosphoesterase, partial [bacterium]|nr:phosphoesterase [bacterium]
EPLGEDAKKAHEGIIRQVCRSGTKVSLLVRSYSPAKREYLIERTIPNPPVVRDDSGAVLTLTPTDVISQVEIYGQHEISELANNRDKLTRLLERFMERDVILARRKSDLVRQLERSRGRLVEVNKELAQIEERLASLPALEEMLKRYQDAGLEEKLKEQSLLVREERVLKTTSERMTPFRELLEQLQRDLPIDRAFLAPKALEDLPGRDILAKAATVLEALERKLDIIADQMTQALAKADQDLAAVRRQWAARKAAEQATYEQILRELQKAKVDGEEFLRLRRQIEELRPLRERKSILGRDLKEQEDNRRNLLVEWEDVKAEEFRRLERAAKKVTRKLSGRVRVQVTRAGNREPLVQLLRDEVGGRLSEATEALREREDLSLAELAGACRNGKDALARG